MQIVEKKVLLLFLLVSVKNLVAEMKLDIHVMQWELWTNYSYIVQF